MKWTLIEKLHFDLANGISKSLDIDITVHLLLSELKSISIDIERESTINSLNGGQKLTVNEIIEKSLEKLPDIDKNSKEIKHRLRIKLKEFFENRYLK